MNREFQPTIPRALVCALTEQLSQHLNDVVRRPTDLDKKTIMFAQRMYIAGIQDALGVLGMEPNPWWTVAMMSWRPVAYVMDDVLKRQETLAEALQRWHGGQDSGLYALSSTMLHCSFKLKIYRVHEHKGHAETGVTGRALTELRGLRARAKYPEAVTPDDIEEANLLADSLEKFLDEFGCELIPKFELRPPTPGNRIDTLVARDVVARDLLRSHSTP